MGALPFRNALHHDYYVDGIHEARKAGKEFPAVLQNAQYPNADIDFQEQGHVALQIKNSLGFKQLSCRTICECIDMIGPHYLCRNPYQKSPNDRWLLANTSGVAVFSGRSPAHCRLFAHIKTGKITTANQLKPVR